jgi:hypothetical protein
MFEALAPEFGFVDGLPKREKSKLARVWDLLKQMKVASEKEGQLVPVNLTCKLLDVSRTRIDQFCERGSLRRVEVAGHVFITEQSIIECAREERKVGRPLNVPTTAKETWKRASAVAQNKS